MVGVPHVVLTGLVLQECARIAHGCSGYTRYSDASCSTIAAPISICGREMVQCTDDSGYVEMLDNAAQCRDTNDYCTIYYSNCSHDEESFLRFCDPSSSCIEVCPGVWERAAWTSDSLRNGLAGVSLAVFVVTSLLAMSSRP
mmetsp:Transcript_44978/g.101199  ORF Transcript_44978/g.101199 Transcript_44978/m.101199 type:complete len:142 (+) Transcript_44978:25-450(+)|eukprot:3648844-Amphidinium_carterae.1